MNFSQGQNRLSGQERTPLKGEDRTNVGLISNDGQNRDDDVPSQKRKNTRQRHTTGKRDPDSVIELEMSELPGSKSAYRGRKSSGDEGDGEDGASGFRF